MNSKMYSLNYIFLEVLTYFHLSPFLPPFNHVHIDDNDINFISQGVLTILTRSTTLVICSSQLP